MSMTSDFGCASCDADGRRQAVAHRAEAARGHPAVRLLEMIVLRGPHLMLADLRRHIDVAALGQLVEPLHRILRLDRRRRVPEGERFPGPPAVDLLAPLGERVAARRASPRSATAAPCPPAHGAQSPTMPRSTLTFLLIEDGSMSMWIFFDPGEKASSRPVMRSSKRAPTAIIRSQSCMALFASKVPCMPSMPSQCSPEAG